MTCYVDLAAGIEELSQYVKVKEISNLANDILTNGNDSGYEMTIWLYKIFRRCWFET